MAICDGSWAGLAPACAFGTGSARAAVRAVEAVEALAQPTLLTVRFGRNDTLEMRLPACLPWEKKMRPARVGSAPVRVSRTADTLVAGIPP